MESGLPATDVVFTDAEHVAIVSHVSSNLQIVDITTGKITIIPTPTYQKLTVLDVIPTLNKVITGDMFGVIRMWDVSGLKAGEVVGELNSEITSISVSSDGLYVAAGSVDGSVSVWNLQTSEQLFAKDFGGSLILDLDFSVFNSLLFVSASGKELSAFDFRSDKQVWSSESLRSDVYVMDVVPRTTYLIAVTSQGVVQLLEATTGKVVKTAQSKGASIRDLSVMPDGTRILMTSRDGALHIWDTKRLHKIVSLPVANELDKIAISPDGSRVSVCGGSPIVHVLDSVSRGDRIEEHRND